MKGLLLSVILLVACSPTHFAADPSPKSESVPQYSGYLREVCINNIVYYTTNQSISPKFVEVGPVIRNAGSETKVGGVKC